MTKDELIELIKVKQGSFKKEELLSFINQLETTNIHKFLPTQIKKGDIFYCHGINHCVVVAKLYKERITCLMSTSTGNIPAKSRFNIKSFSMVLLSYPRSSISFKTFKGVYDNNAHLDEVYNYIKSRI